jgi:hypothetical protein
MRAMRAVTNCCASTATHHQPRPDHCLGSCYLQPQPTIAHHSYLHTLTTLTNLVATSVRTASQSTTSLSAARQSIPCRGQLGHTTLQHTPDEAPRGRILRSTPWRAGFRRRPTARSICSSSALPRPACTWERDPIPICIVEPLLTCLQREHAAESGDIRHHSLKGSAAQGGHARVEETDREQEPKCATGRSQRTFPPPW